MHKLHILVLIAALSIGAGVRINGMAWGLPDGVHAEYSYHPDEASLLEWASDLYHGAILSKQFIYGGTFYFTTLHAGSRLADALSEQGRATLRERLLVTRATSVLCAVLTILFTYSAAAMLFTPAAGLWAALLLALAPGHVIIAQASRPDALFTLLLCLNLYLAARLMSDTGRAQWPLIAAGAALGVAVATRFPAALWWLGHVAALLMSPRDTQGRWRSIAILSGVAVLAYLVASPHSWMYYPVLLDGLATQFSYQRGAAASDLAGDASAWRYAGTVMAEALGYGAYVPAYLALAMAAWRRSRADRLLAVFALPYFLSLTSTHWVVARYFVPLLPLLLIWLGALAQQGLRGARVARMLTLAVAGLGLTVNVLAVGIYSAALRVPDSRDRALQWLLAHAPAGTRIGVLQGYDGDVFFHPPAIGRFRWSACALNHCDAAELFSAQHELLVIADTFLDEINAAGQVMKVADALAAQTGYEPLVRFSPRLKWWGYDVGPQFRTPDLRDALTTLTIYRRPAAQQ